MSFVTTQPELITAAAGDLAGIGSMLTVGSAAAAGPTTGVVPAAADEVSALTATQFATQAQLYQAIARASRGHSPAIRGHIGGQRGFLRSHRSRQRGRGQMTGTSRWITQFCHRS
jgi:hypothetical protein